MSVKYIAFDYSDDHYRHLARINTAVTPDHPASVSYLRREDNLRDPKYSYNVFLIEQGNEIVGSGLYHHIDWMYHPQRFWIMVNVMPDYRRQGIGGATYDFLMQQLVSEDAAQLLTMAKENWVDSLHFLESRGFEESMRDWESWLESAKVDLSQFEAHEQRVAEQGIQIQTIAELDQVDPQCRRKLYDLEWDIELDLPRAVDDEPTQVPFETWNKSRASSHPDFLPDAYFVAVDKDAYVGMSALWASEASDNLYTGLTGVRREYRRRGIATALKIKAIRYAQQKGGRRIITWNAQTNPMFDINERVGFIKQPAGIVFRKDIKPLADIES